MAAVEKIEEMRKPDDFFGYRNRTRCPLMAVYRKGLVAHVPAAHGKDSLGQALASGAHPRRIEMFESLPTNTKKEEALASSFLVHRKGLEPPTLGPGIRCSIH